ncbi:carbonic anhydrase [soil metagenome]
MNGFNDLLVRNRDFADAAGHHGASVMPRLGLGIVTCLDPRVDPASFLGLGPSEATVMRNAGGRVTERVIADISFTTFMAQLMAVGAGIELAVVHHTGCGTGFLADDGFRTSYARHSGYDPSDLLAEAVTDAAVTVRADVSLLLAHPLVPRGVTVSGHVYDLDTGLVETVIPATAHGQVPADGAA